MDELELVVAVQEVLVEGSERCAKQLEQAEELDWTSGPAVCIAGYSSQSV